MGTITAFESITVDGVMQGLGRPDEDTRDDFAHGGWGNGYQDDVSMAFAAEGMQEEGALLFGRRTYEDMLGFWTAFDQPNPFSDVLVHSPKHVVSRSTSTVLAYPNSTLQAGDAVETIRRLRAETPLPLTIMGSGSLVRSLHAAGLIDRFTLQIHPIILGSGRQLFGPADRANLRLERSITTTTGVIIADYAVDAG